MSQTKPSKNVRSCSWICFKIYEEIFQLSTSTSSLSSASSKVSSSNEMRSRLRSIFHRGNSRSDAALTQVVVCKRFAKFPRLFLAVRIANVSWNLFCMFRHSRNVKKRIKSRLNHRLQTIAQVWWHRQHRKRCHSNKKLIRSLITHEKFKSTDEMI